MSYKNYIKTDFKASKKGALTAAAAVTLSVLAVSSLVYANDSADSKNNNQVGVNEETQAKQNETSHTKLNISSEAGSGGENKQNSTRQSNSAETNTEVRVNDQDIPVKKNGVTKRTIKSKDGNTKIIIENHSSSNGSSTNLSTNSTNLNSSSSVQSYSSTWSSE